MAPELRSASAPADNGGANGLRGAGQPDSTPPAASLTDLHAAKVARRAAKRQAAMDADPDWPPQKTLWRGVLHQHAALAALTAGIMLVISAPGPRAKIGCGIYAGRSN